MSNFPSVKAKEFIKVIEKLGLYLSSFAKKCLSL